MLKCTYATWLFVKWREVVGHPKDYGFLNLCSLQRTSLRYSWVKTLLMTAQTVNGQYALWFRREEPMSRFSERSTGSAKSPFKIVSSWNHNLELNQVVISVDKLISLWSSVTETKIFLVEISDILKHLFPLRIEQRPNVYKWFWGNPRRMCLSI